MSPKILTNVNTETISDDKCIHSDLPKVINETEKDIMDKIATHSDDIKIFLSILKGSPLENTNRIVTYRTDMYVNHIKTENVHNSLQSPIIFYGHL